MILPVLEVVVTSGLLSYAIHWRRKQVQRKAADWNSIVARLRSHSEFGFDAVSERYLYGEGITATPSNIWERIDGANGLWAMYTNAGVLMDLADYATEHGQRIPEEAIESLRSDALHIRIAVLMALVRFALCHSRVAAAVHAHRATAAYGSMVAHTTAMFQDHSALFFPRFLEAM